jgi:GntR family transcriptional regulator
MVSPEPAAAGAPEPRTLHEKLTRQLLERIRSGLWPVGSNLPSEKALCEEAKVSRHTLRHALKALQDRGYIERSQGAASKVISCREPRIYTQDYNTMREVLSYPGNTYRENRVEGYIECDSALQPLLKAPLGSSWYHIGAIRREERSGLALAWTDIHILPRFAKVAKMKNHEREMVFEQIERHFGVAIERAEVQIDVEALSPRVARLLEVPPGTPCMVIVRRYFDQRGEPFEVTITRHPQGRFSFAMELKGVSRPSPGQN